jgi:hypothetical protein
MLTMAVSRNTTPVAGPFDADNEFQFKCHVRKGDVRENSRGGKLVEFMAKMSEGLEVAKAKVLSFARRTLPSAQLVSEDLCFKKSKGASQGQRLVLTEQNFPEKTKSRWELISQSDVVAWASDGKTALEGFVFEIFMRAHRRSVESVPTGLWRATAGRTEASVRQIRQHEDQSNAPMGPITRQHAATRQAR